ncbi:MAG: hypothetical protein GF419_05780 [Ignavibacteriales bacterium]|nr:hypothetical protein [Ignavibacteriales bacterium]
MNRRRWYIPFGAALVASLGLTAAGFATLPEDFFVGVFYVLPVMASALAAAFATEHIGDERPYGKRFVGAFIGSMAAGVVGFLAIAVAMTTVVIKSLTENWTTSELIINYALFGFWGIAAPLGAAIGAIIRKKRNSD